MTALESHFSRFAAAGLLDKPVGRLSGGELQRVLLAVATLPQPDLLILDEPGFRRGQRRPPAFL